MDLSLRFISVNEMEPLKEFVKDKLSHANHRLGEIKSCNVIFRDQNGPRGGVDNTCHLTVTHQHAGAFDAYSTKENYFEAFADCLNKAALQISRANQKRIARRRRGQKAKAAMLISTL